MRIATGILILGLLATTAYAQGVPGSGALGTGVSLSGAAAFNAGDIATITNDINAEYFVSQHVKLGAGLGLATTKDVGTSFNISLSGAYYLNKAQLSPFLGAAFFVSINSPTGANSNTSVGFILGGGAEYFFSKNFGVALSEGFQFNTEPVTFALVSRINLNVYF
jgi:hypothetical protein